MTLLRKLADWLTPERRQLVRVFLGTVAPIVIVLGWATQDQTQQVLIAVGVVGQFVMSLLSLVYLRWSLSTVWTVVRGAVYALATALAPVLTALGAIDESTSGVILTGASLGLSSLSALVAILTTGQQETAAVEAVTLLDGTVTTFTRREYRSYLDQLAADADQARASTPLVEDGSVIRGED